MERPAGVTILAVLAFVGTGLSVLAAVGMLVGGAMVANMIARPGFGMATAIGGAVLGVFFLGVGALYAVIGTGMLNLWNWLRVLVIVLSFVGAFFYALGILTALLHFHPVLVLWRAILLGVNLWIAFYLLKPHVKQAFGATGF
jgi:hypothetical protein